MQPQKPAPFLFLPYLRKPTALKHKPYIIQATKTATSNTTSYPSFKALKTKTITKLDLTGLAKGKDYFQKDPLIFEL